MKLTGSRCQCLGCGEYFNSVSAFDKHRVDALCETRRCLNVKEILSLDLTKNEAGFWITGTFIPFKKKTA